MDTLQYTHIKPLTVANLADKHSKHAWPYYLLLLLIILALVACGGGGSSSSDTPVPDTINPDNGGTGSPNAAENDPSHANNTVQFPTRLVQGPDSRLYVTDAELNSVFIFSTDLLLQKEISNLGSPLGIAIRTQPETGIVVGSSDRDRIDIYTMNGDLVGSFGNAEIQSPSDIVIDSNGNYYVADSKSNTVWVYNVEGVLTGSIGKPGGSADGELNFPTGLHLATRNNRQELFVADTSNSRIQVFALDGTFLRTLGSSVKMGETEWQGRFGRPQSVLIDQQDRLHVADIYLNRVQILNPDTGAYISSYGGFGTEQGQFKLPMDIEMTSAGTILVNDADNARIQEMN